MNSPSYDEILADKAYEVERLEVGAVATLPDGSDVELTAHDGEDGVYVTSINGRPATVTSFTTASEQSAVAIAIVRASLERALA